MKVYGRIKPEGCPGGMVVIVFDDHGNEIKRAKRAKVGERPSAAIREEMEAMIEGKGRVCLYDGDTGELRYAAAN